MVKLPEQDSMTKLNKKSEQSIISVHQKRNPEKPGAQILNKGIEEDAQMSRREIEVETQSNHLNQQNAKEDIDDQKAAGGKSRGRTNNL